MESPFYTHLKQQLIGIEQQLIGIEQQLIGIKQSGEKLSPEEQAKLNEDIKRLHNEGKRLCNEPIDELSPENIKQLELIYNIKITVHRDKNVPGLTAIKSFENADFKNCGCFTRALEMVKEYCDANSSQGKPTYIHKNTKGTFYAFCPEKGSRAGTKSKLSEGLSSQIDSKGYISIQIEWL